MSRFFRISTHEGTASIGPVGLIPALVVGDDDSYSPKLIDLAQSSFSSLTLFIYAVEGGVLRILTQAISKNIESLDFYEGFPTSL